MKKIIFVFCLHPTLTHEKNYYFQDLIKKRVDFEVWDITEIIFGPLQLPDEIDRKYIIKFDSKFSFKKKLSLENVKETIFVVAVGYDTKSFWLFRLLTKYDGITCCLDRGSLPRNNRTVKLQKIIKIVKSIDLKLLIKITWNLFFEFLKRTPLINDYNLVFTAGFKSMQRYKKSIKNIPINSIDYEKYLNSLEVNENLVDEEYIVFLDDYLPAHPDLIILGLRTVSSELYYNNINHFFRLLEKNARKGCCSSTS